MLSWLNYEVSTCGSLAEARALLNERKNWFDVVLTDMHIGNDTGLEILAMLKRSDPSPVRIVITGFATKDMTVACLREGAFDFIEKPFTSTILTTTLNRAMMHRRLIQENWRYQERLEELVRLRSQNLTTALEQLRNSYAQTIRALATMIDLRETGTGQHCFAVGAAIRVMAQMMGVPAHDREVMEMGAALHDIGKIGIPDSILLKPSSLSEDDWVVMRSHSEIGFNLLSGVPFLQEVAQMVHSHHERFDGKGYPRGLKGEQIPLGSRLFAVIDSYHAMRSDRSYRKAMPAEVAVAEIKKNAGAQFDPAVVAAFMKCQAEIESAFAESKPGG
jgi:putative nucleotidyltransferase with HDIG domain